MVATKWQPPPQPNGNIPSSSSFSSSGVGVKNTPTQARAPVSQRFGEFWAKYPVKDNQHVAFGVWDGLVTTENEARVFACLDRYLVSDRGGRSPKNPSNWLHDCARDNWESDWPRAREAQTRPLTATQQAIQRAKEREANGERC